MSYIPKRGDIIFINLDPTRGHEQGRERPALVVSPVALPRTFGLCWVLPITTKMLSGSRNAFLIPVHGGKINGHVLTHQIRTIDWTARQARFVEAAPADSVAAAITAVKAIINAK